MSDSIQANGRTGRLHHDLLRSLIEIGSIPSDAELCESLACNGLELERAIEDLADQHGVVLHPNSRRVWAIHPFSLAPTPFLVQSGARKWWGNCAWCSLGIAALIDAPCTITTSLGAEEERVVISVANGRASPSDLVVHFPIPMRRAWDNVVYTCSTMLVFRDESQVREWSLRHRIDVGDIQPIGRVFEFARRWYGDHLRADWRKKSVDEAHALFAELGFDHAVWQLSATSERF